VLEAGGNAVDAAIATSYALAVTHPSAGGLGGGGFMVVHLNGATTTFDFRETAPEALTAKRYAELQRAGGVGPTAVGVPGIVAGLELARERLARLPREALMRPAVTLAREGHVMSSWQARTLAWSWPALRNSAAARALFAPRGTPYRAGDRVKQSELASTLERVLRDGRDGFYRGFIVEQILSALGSARLLERADFEAYQAIERAPLKSEYRGYALAVMPPPSAGAVALLGVLSALESQPKEVTGSVPWLHYFLEASRRAQAVRRFEVADPAAFSPTELEGRIARWTARPPQFLSAFPIDPARATRSNELERTRSVSAESEHTTHFSVADADGGVVSCTITLSGSFGSRVVVKGTGLVLNNAAASFATDGDNTAAPGRRTTSSMSPGLVFRGSEPVMVFGSPGGETIPSTLAQVITSVLDRHLPLDEAVTLGRLHQGFLPDEVRYEGTRPPSPAVLRELKAKGHRFSSKRTPMGGANFILLDGPEKSAFADPREEGQAIAQPSTLGAGSR
jgi:gamma-glutamyltranspeptidase/glutathione hydrolase